MNKNELVKNIERVEVNNVYTLYEKNEDGSEAEKKLLCFGSRPQDWGNLERWTYSFCEIKFAMGLTLYISRCHVWCEVTRTPIEAFQAIGPALFSVYQPGTPIELCGRSHLAEDDFWCDEWGKMPSWAGLEPEEEW